MSTVGFVGLGNMGSVLAGNLVRTGHSVVVHDALGPGRAPEGSEYAESAAEVARRAEVVVLSLPDGKVSEQVCRQLAGAARRQVVSIVDTSTVGVRSARTIAALLAGDGIGYLDAPVSGGPAGAKARTLMVMYAGSDQDCARAEPVLAGLSDRTRRVGAEPGMGQALKLANNFLSATALAATSEAVAFGCAAGLDMETMLEVLDASSGRSSATGDKFPAHVVTGRYASGFSNTLMAKDVRLYLEAAERDASARIGAATGSVWAKFAADEPGADFTRIYPYLSGG